MSKILIIDDDPDIIEATEAILSTKGYKVLSSGNKSEGLKLIDEFEPDLLILDVMMEQPDDGIMMAQELRRNGFKSPIIMVSGISKVTGLDYDKDNTMVPVDSFLEKPIKPEALMAKIEELLESKED